MRNINRTFNNRRPYLSFLVIFVTIIVSSCSLPESDYDKQREDDDEKISKYLTNNNIQATKDEIGFYYIKLTENSGGQELNIGDVVSFYYKMSSLDGTLIDESIESRDTISQFRLGYNAIIPTGLDYAIQLMKTGEKYRFFMPSYCAYYYISGNKIKSFENLIIDIEVLNKQTVTQINDTQLDSIQNYVETNYTLYDKFADGLYYIPVSEGTGDKPFAGSKVTVSFTRKYLDGTIIKKTPDNSPSVFNIDNNQAVKGLEEGLLQMNAGGKAVLVMPASIGFMQSICIVPESMRKVLLNDKIITAEVLPYSIIMYDVELVSVNE